MWVPVLPWSSQQTMKQPLLKSPLPLQHAKRSNAATKWPTSLTAASKAKVTECAKEHSLIILLCKERETEKSRHADTHWQINRSILDSQRKIYCRYSIFQTAEWYRLYTSKWPEIWNPHAQWGCQKISPHLTSTKKCMQTKYFPQFLWKRVL